MKNIICNTYFSCPIYTYKDTFWIKQLNKISDGYLKKSLLKTKKQIKERNNIVGNVDDHGFSYHSNQMVEDKRIKKFEDFLTDISWNILNSQGYKMDDYKMVINELWVQQFAKSGGGHHDTHIHGNNHISGFYFLKGSKKTSFPIFHAPNAAKLMSQLPLKNEKEFSLAMDKVNYSPEPGTFIFFNSYMPHQFSVDDGVEEFRFIHFNIQAINKFVFNLK